MRITMVVSTFDHAKALNTVLAGYAAQSRLPDEVVIADDGSGPDTLAVISTWVKQAPFVLRHVRQEHQGFRKCRILNQSILATTSDYVVIADGDCLPHKDFVKDHLSLAEAGFWVQGKRAQIKEAFANQIKADDANGLRLWLSRRSWRNAYGVRWPLPVVWRQTEGPLRERALGSNMGIWRDDLLSINGFNEAFIGWGDEDREVTVRLHRLGRRKKFVIGRALQFHLDHPPSSRSSQRDNGAVLAASRMSLDHRCEHGLDGHR